MTPVDSQFLYWRYYQVFSEIFFLGANFDSDYPNAENSEGILKVPDERH